MRLRIAGGILLLARSASLPATPWGRHAVGDVRIVAGNPAICVPLGAKKTLAVESVWLIKDENTATSTARSTVWELEVLPHAKRLALQPGACIVYAETYPGYRNRVPPRALAPGHYKFRMNAEAKSRADVVAYWGVFHVELLATVRATQN